MKTFFISLFLIICGFSVFAQDCNLNDEAKRHFSMAEGMRKVIDNADDWQLIADEYEKAAQAAPNCPAIYYNLGLCYQELGKKQPELCDKAIAYFQKYLQLSPTAENKNDVESLIYEIQGQKVMYQKQQQKDLEKWCGKWMLHYIGTFIVDGSEFDESIEYIEIFISQGSLKVKVPNFIQWTTYFKPYKSNQTAFTAQIIPVTLNSDNISFSYTVSHQDIFPDYPEYPQNKYEGKRVNDYTVIRKFKFHLVSSDRMEGLWLGDIALFGNVESDSRVYKLISTYLERR